METNVKLEIVGLMQNQRPEGTYGLVLQEEGGNRRFSMLIGEAEAQSITLKLRNKELPRPLTHELMCNTLRALCCQLEKVLIYAFVNGIFCAELHIITADGHKCTVDARTSDAVALAVRAGCPICIKREIFDLVGMTISSPKLLETLDDLEDASPDEMRLLSRQRLSTLLQQAVSEERYELAAKLKGLIDEKR